MKASLIVLTKAFKYVTQSIRDYYAEPQPEETENRHSDSDRSLKSTESPEGPSSSEGHSSGESSPVHPPLEDALPPSVTVPV